MGALLVASVSSFVSCKDYDDDINDLQGQIDKLAAQTALDNLQSTLSSQISAAQAAAQAAQATADQAVKDAAKAGNTADAAATKTAVETVDAAAKAAGEEAAKAITNAATAKDAADAAQKTADAAAAAAKAAQEAADAAAASGAAGAAQAAKDAAAAAAKADVAQAAADAAKAAADAAQAAADKNKADLAAVEAIAKAAKDAADKAAAAAAAAAGKEVDLTGYYTKTQIDNLLKNYASATNDYVTKTALQDEVKKLQDQLDKIQTLGDLNAFKQKVDNYEAGINSIYTAITSISVYATMVPTAATGALNTEDQNNNFPSIQDLTFIKSNINSANAHFTRFVTPIAAGMNFGQHYADGNFGNANAKDYFGAAAAYNATTAEYFKHGDPVKYPTSIIVRVSPSNAELTKEGVKLIDGNGNTLSVVEIDNVTPYNALLTRAGSNSGLWKIDLKVAGNTNVADIQKATLVAANGRYITGTAATIAAANQGLFAVAATTTANVNVQTAANRFAISEYAITFHRTAPILAYVGPWSLTGANGNVVITGASDGVSKNLQQVKNRVLGGAYAGTYVDNEWTDAGATAGVVVDNRAAQNFFTINNGGTVTVDLTRVNNGGIQPKAYYIVRDDRNSDQANNWSELNAWLSYNYSGDLNKLLDPAKDKAQITITIPETLIVGDAIAFRIFAVNHDGTLVDPDGAAFEVFVGPSAGVNTVTGTFTPTQAGGQWYYYDFVPTVKQGTLVNAGVLQMKIGNTVVNNMNYRLTRDKNNNLAANWDEVKYIRVQTATTAPQMTAWADGKEATGEITFTTGTPATQVNKITVKLTKVMPTSVPNTLTWKSQQPGNPLQTSNYICYAYPETTLGTYAPTWLATWAAGGYKNMNESMNGLDDTNYIFVLENMLPDWSGAFTQPQSFVSGGANIYNIEIARSQVTDAGTTHNGKIYYRYNNISSSNQNVDPIDVTGATKNNNWYVEGKAYSVTFKCPLAPDMQTYSFAKTQPTYNADGSVNRPARDVNTINYTETPNTVVVPNYVGYGAEGAQPFIYYISGKNSWNNTTFGKRLNQLVPAGHATAVPGYAQVVDAKLTSDETGVAEYFDVTWNAAGNNLVFTSKSGTTNPIADVPSTLTLRVRDAYNHTITITLPMIVKHI